MTTAKHQILIVGGDTAGISVAARMLRKGYPDVAVIEPSEHALLPAPVAGGVARCSGASDQRTASEHPIR